MHNAPTHKRAVSPYYTTAGYDPDTRAEHIMDIRVTSYGVTHPTEVCPKCTPKKYTGKHRQ